MIAAPLRHKHFLWLLGGVGAVYLAVLAYVVAVRVRFPYDTFIWSESPFLTNMLKLHNGVELYGPPADANSFVYSPGLEYLCFTVLSPFGRHLDLTSCRIVNVVVAVAAALAACSVQVSITARMTMPGPSRRAVVVFTALASTLLVFKNFTVDVCHPDNLHLLHLAGGMALALVAMQREDFRLALLCAALLGGGILLKQTCAFGGVGVATFLAVHGRRRWGLARSALVIAAALATTALGAYWLLVAQPYGRFWLLTVLSHHTAAISKLDAIWSFEAHALYRLPLYVGAPLCAIRGLTSRNDKLRHMTGLWLSAGIFGALPGLAAYVKTFGLWNNLVVIDLWASLMVVPTLIAVSYEGLEHRPERTRGLVALTALSVMTLGLYPTKRMPSADQLRYGRQLEAALRDDFAAGRHVLVAHGTAALIRAGFLDVPLDRSNSILELGAANLEQQAKTEERFNEAIYDRIYVAWPTYPGRMEAALQNAYQTMSLIPGSTVDEQTMINGLSAHMLVQINVHERRPNRRPKPAESP